MQRRDFLKTTTAAAAATLLADWAPGSPFARGAEAAAGGKERHLLYIAEPGIRNYERYGGVGVLIYDIGAGYTFVKRVPTWETPAGKEPENVKGVCASAKTGKLYVSTIKRIGCIDLHTEKMLWSKELEGGCDRMAIAPDGSILYVPSLEGPHWNVIDGATGDPIAQVLTNSGAHNTIFGLDGTKVYLAGLKSPLLNVADAKTHKVIKQVGPFGSAIRPFTVNAAQTLTYVNVNELLGFEIGDLKTGEKLHRVEVKGFEKGPVDRHGCPSHGIGLTPDDRELWVCDGHNKAIHIYDNTVMPPKQMSTLQVRDQPGWITFSIDGRHAYPSTGEIFDTKSKKLIVALQDEQKRDIGSEKLLEMVFSGEKPTRAGDQFGYGTKI
jgi:DNA-binding beta-propeller fold protein YncE